MGRTAVPLVLLVLIIAAVWYSWGKLPWHQTATAPKPLPSPLTYQTSPAAGFLAPDFHLKTIDGRDVRLGDVLGRPVVVTFWATWCPFCLGELQDFGQLAKEYQGRAVVIAVNRGEAPQTVQQFFTKNQLPAGILFVMDPTDTLYQTYRATTMPETFFIDATGVVRALKPAVLGIEGMSSGIQALFAVSSGR